MQSKEDARLLIFESYCTDEDIINWCVIPVMKHQTEAEQDSQQTIVKNYTGFRKGDAKFFHRLLNLWNKPNRSGFEQDMLNWMLQKMRTRIVRYWRQI